MIRSRLFTRLAFAMLLPCAALLAAGNVNAQSASFPARSSARIVFVGHSLINYWMPEYLQAVATSLGFNAYVAVQVQNGTPLIQNWRTCHARDFNGEYPPKVFACDAIEAASGANAFDAFVATDANNTIESNRIYNETHKYFEYFMNLMLSRNPAARSYVYTSWESWGYHRTGTWYDAIPSELAQYELIASQAQQLSAARGQNGRVDVLPTNVALSNLLQAVDRGQAPGITRREQVFEDGIHMTKLGNYFMACVVFSAVYNRSPAGAAARILNEYGQVEVDLSAATAQFLQNLAWQTVSTYRSGATPSSSRPRAPGDFRIN